MTVPNRFASYRAGTVCLVSMLAALLALVAPSAAQAERPDIDRVVVSREDGGHTRFRIAFAAPMTLSLDDRVQVAIDADRDPGTGIDGLDYSLDWSIGTVSLLTAVDGEPVESHPRSLRFSRERDDFEVAAVTFSVAAEDIDNPARFDFYVFVEKDDALDEAPSHVLVSASAAPWTYPKEREPAAGAPYPSETYIDASDFTLSERGWVFLAVTVGAVLGVAAILAVGGWSVQRLRARRKPG